MELSITVILIIITVISSFYGFNNHSFIERWMFTPYKIKHQKQWDRFILSGFIHKDYIHLLFNMFTFYFFGRVVEQFLAYQLGSSLGGVVFVLFYILGIIIADIPTYLKHQNNSYYRALGASGGTAATVFSSIIILPLADICLFGIICLPGFILGALFLIYSYTKGKQDSDGINHDAHLYGALFGIIFILILSPSSAVHFIDQIRNWRIF
ncbi:Membrane associated serine protease, rhomboid family [Algoriphagus ornithinivorans]|jgi:membrane associated rhomboid family serine protease|uniref:Membrane associated serine protease, rhomboid family n=1 Tax=Algoriphagus ornithinivorans TaxID=226506 RepID=A0A1I5JFS9_9BACT|nr:MULTISPECIES: rhomboid family intramembrane serine protease [Algoriphagus]MAL13148.1 rhomboid family intramembrane serine protease [Algoriphagus sp.]MAN87273.1 rhomboid family intramembrane serine protease [Algoriphagus sp.]QYH41087.1 rhomboid family intramembrane serine protease [Algoriphagus sp. NBT04N3]SFO71688.1 Membrane associated serine protease, rhomboid family [Algoriphagus ornithinivorans]HAD50484.1 rhomboid family intramembrane serine protease [Algoriphagus sp.]|tara:strand:- start:17202 stop:17831 length:630 start_codon:yes stop_codon:yes gene_type:complete